MSEIQKGKIKLFACGGGGINIGAKLQNHITKGAVGFGDLEVVFIDTSRSNLEQAIDQKACYLIEGLDGSGKVRSENHQEIGQHIRDILQMHKPGEVNLVLSTAAGGSGSVIAPSLVSELLSREIPVIVLTIGNADTRLETENTLKTLKSYEAIAKMRKAPVVMSYVQNDENATRQTNDARISYVIMALCSLYSRQNKELDSKDLFNFLRFDRVTSFQPMLASLTLLSAADGDDIFSGLNQLGHIISVASVVRSDQSPKLPMRPEYQCTGFLPSDADSVLQGSVPMHFVTSDGVFHQVATQLQKLIDEMEETRNARVHKSGLLGNGDRPTETGLVL